MEFHVSQFFVMSSQEDLYYTHVVAWMWPVPQKPLCYNFDWGGSTGHGGTSGNQGSIRLKQVVGFQSLPSSAVHLAG